MPNDVDREDAAANDTPTTKLGRLPRGHRRREEAHIAVGTYDADREAAIRDNTYTAGGKTWHLPRDTHDQLENTAPSACSRGSEIDENPWAHDEAGAHAHGTDAAGVYGVEFTGGQTYADDEAEA
jgi:hypothetical protein